MQEKNHPLGSAIHGLIQNQALVTLAILLQRML